MKRAASEILDGAPLPKRNHINGSPVLSPTVELGEPTCDHSDNESSYQETTSVCPADTPLTPLSPTRKWPSDLKTIRCTYPDCDKTFNRPARLAAHLRSHKNERPFICPYSDCDKDYIEEKHLKQHIKGSHTSERNHVCTYNDCGKQFMTATRLRRHQLVHQGQERFKCRDFPPCGQSFRKHQTLQRHIRTEHQHEPAFQCDHQVEGSGSVCGQGFDTAGALRRHQEREHSENRFWCDECAATTTDDMDHERRVGFPTLVLLQAHMKHYHINCMFCGKSCNGREELEQHIELDHTNHKPVEERKTIVCTWPGCTKSFTRTSNLNVHIRSVHESVRFVCGHVDLSKTEDLATWSISLGCGQAFVSKLALENHVRYVHLQRERPETHHSALRPPSQPAPLQHQADPTILEQLVGVGEKSRRTLPCRFADCHQKFTYSGELEAHVQSEHQIEQALLDGMGEPSATLEPFPALQDRPPSTTEWELDYGGDIFWVGTDAGMEAVSPSVERPVAEDDWLRDEAEMRKLIGPDEFDGLIDPSLGSLPL